MVWKVEKNQIMLDNYPTVHMFSNSSLLHNIRLSDEPVDVQSSGGIAHWNIEGAQVYLGDVLLL